MLACFILNTRSFWGKMPLPADAPGRLISGTLCGHEAEWCLRFVGIPRFLQGTLYKYQKILPFGRIFKFLLSKFSGIETH